MFTDDGDVDTEREDYQRTDFQVTTSNKQLNFLQHIMTIMAENGRPPWCCPTTCCSRPAAASASASGCSTHFDFHTLLRLPTGIFYKPGVKANVLFFDKRPAAETPWTKTVWIYDFRTNQNFTLKERPLKRAHLDEFVSVGEPRGDTSGKRANASGPSAMTNSSSATN